MSTASRPSSAFPVSSDELREHQSNERTYLSWVRTGLALMGFGFVVARFGVVLRALPGAPQTNGGPTSLWFGTALVALSVVVFVVSTYRYARLRRAIASRHCGRPRAALVYAVGLLAAVIAGGLAVFLGLALRS